MYEQAPWTFIVMLWAGYQPLLSKKTLVGDEAALNSRVTSTDVFCLLSLNAFSAHCCVCEGNILCLLRSCLRLCGVGCFIPWEDNRPASLTGTCDLTRSCHLALTLAAVGDHCMLFLWSHSSQNAIHTRWSIRFIFCIVCDPNISVFEVLFLLELCY